MPTDRDAGAPAIPLARWADRQLKTMGRNHAIPALSALEGAVLMGERGANGGYTINGTISAGLGGSRLLPTHDGGWFALTLIRSEDRELLPALFGQSDFDISDNAAIAALVSEHDCAELVERGRALGLPVASADEVPARPAMEIMTRGLRRDRSPQHRPLVIDLSAIWAGPLAGHLFWQAGMEVIKVESPTRPDLIRRDDPATFDLINQGKASVLVDLHREADKARLIAWIRRADVVIESSRPRALRHLGIEADVLVREVPGLVWLSVTGHGATGEPAHWVGIGNDCGVAGGLSRAMEQLSGRMGYVGDAIADPLTGITAAREGLKALKAGEAMRIGLSMSAITAMALAEEQTFDRVAIDAELRAWSAAQGKPFPHLPRRTLQGEVRPLGADTPRWIAQAPPC